MTDWQNQFNDTALQITKIRRELHQNPELSGKEVETQKKVISVLEKIEGIKLSFVKGNYAVIAELDNGEGKCAAVRSDMDALPVTENTALPFASQNKGVMHACGHDVHTALGLGSALWMSENRDKWHGKIKWLFEPEEETIGGGKAMAEAGCMNGVDIVIGQHVNPNYPAGTFFAKAGYVSGSSDKLTLTVHGKSCHGAYPESGVDAIVIAAQIISALQSLISRTISPFTPAVITFGKISGGTANNIVCDKVELTGTLRTLSDDVRQKLQNEISVLCKSIAEGMGGKAEISIEPGYGAVYNDDDAYGVIENAARRIVGDDKIVIRKNPSLGVESFCYFTENTPGVYYDVGCGVGTALHTPTFCVDESCILPALAIQCCSLIALLER